MIVYKPSRGNSTTPVRIDRENRWFGESLGGSIIDFIQQEEFPNKNIFSPMDSSSTWFFNPVTDWDFINSSTTYRAIYIGASELHPESEILGEITAQVLNDSSNPLIDNSVSIEMWQEGVFNNFTSKKSLVLFDEYDTTNVLSGATWSSSITNNQVLRSGECVKVWLKINVEKSIDILEVPQFQYEFIIGDLTIKVLRERGRLTNSRVYTAEIGENKIVMDETIPLTFNIHQPLTTYYFQNNLSVVYNEDNEIKLVSVKKNQNINDNKYIECNISQEIDGILPLDIEYNTPFFVECLSEETTGTETTGATGIEDILEKKIIYKTIKSKTDTNNIYLFYNKLSSIENTQRYNYNEYRWETGVIHIDINNINNKLFEKVNPGFENTKNVNLNDYFETTFLSNFFATDVVVEDDLFTISGLTTEDCRNSKHNPKLIHIWEGQIWKQDINVQILDFPACKSNKILTIPNQSDKESYLLVENEQKINVSNNNFNRKLREFEGIEWVKMGPPSMKQLDVSDSPVTFDIMGQLQEEYSISWAFSLSEETLTTGTTGTTGIDTTGMAATGTETTGATGIPEIDELYPPYYHVKNQSDFNDLFSYELPEFLSLEQSIQYVPGNRKVFSVHCNGNKERVLVDVYYSFKDKTWEVTTIDKDNQEQSWQIKDSSQLSVLHHNTINVNIFKQKIFGCSKIYQVYVNVFVNGKEIISTTSYSFDTSDDFVVTYNPHSHLDGAISYVEVKPYLLQESFNYAKNFFMIHSNISWSKFEAERENRTDNNDLKPFNYRRSILMNGLVWGIKETFLLPVVIQGLRYNLGDSINDFVRRSSVDLRKINLIESSLAFTLEGDSRLLNWYAEDYNIDKDVLVVWVELNGWNGSRLIMYYNDTRLIKTKLTNSPYSDFHAVWNIPELQTIHYPRYDEFNIFSMGDLNVTTKNNDKYTLYKVSQPYLFGKKKLYRSHLVDIAYDDTELDYDNKIVVDEFVEKLTNDFKPAKLTLRKVRSLYENIIESGKNN